MKSKGHESFAIRRGWLYKGMKHVRARGDIFLAKDAMEELGLGSNMVKSLRYWMQATGLTEETSEGSRRVQKLTPLGNLIWHEDPYAEELGTLWLLHAHLAANAELATSWHFFFQCFRMQEFTKEDFVRALRGEADAAESSLASDFDCILATYIPRTLLKGRVDPESNIDCPLGALGLLRPVSVNGNGSRESRSKVYRREVQDPARIPPEIFFAVLLVFAAEKKELPLQDVLSGTDEMAGAGRVFGLDFAGLLAVLYRIEQTGALRVVRTAGLDVVRIMTAEPPLAWVQRYYEGLVGEG